MSDEVVGFNRQDADALLREIGNTGGEVRQFSHPLGGSSSVSLAKTGATSIAALSGTTLGSGTVTIQTIAGGTIADTTRTVTAYNFWPVDISGSSFVPIAQDRESGLWMITSPSLSAVTAIVDNQVDGANNELEEKTQQFHAPGVQTASGWTVWHTGTDCSA